MSPPTGHRFTIALLVLLTLSQAWRPIANDDLWWQLSRGRAVVSGTMTPSRLLLAGDRQGEADWLGGAPFFAVYAITGITGLMVLKTICLSGMAVWCWRRGSQIPLAERTISTASMVVLLSTSCEPTAGLWNVLGLLCAVSLSRRVTSSSWQQNLVAWGLLAVTWANLGSLPILILLPLVSRQSTTVAAGTKQPKMQHPVCVWITVLIGMCLTPRGVLTSWDAVRQLAPILFESGDVLRDTEWRSFWIGPRDSSMLAWISLTAIGLSSILVRGRTTHQSRRVLAFVVVQSLVLWSRSNLAVLSIWLMLWVIDCWSFDETEPLESGEKRRTTGLSPKWVADVVCLSVAIIGSLGEWPFNDGRLGWGLSTQLDQSDLTDTLRPLSRLPQAATTGMTAQTAHCTDIRSAGMVAWARRGDVRPYLTPQRALLNGRLREEVLLNRELAAGWLRVHRRSDGTDGGWWHVLRTRNTLLLVTSSRRTDLIRGLEGTIWKPLSWSTPVIAYALAGYPLFTSQISAVPIELEAIDRGPWSSKGLADSHGATHLDVIALLFGWPDLPAIHDQSAVLRAMILPLGAMRVLRPALRSFNNRPGIRDELFGCQIELAERERRSTGRIGEFRLQVLKALSAQQNKLIPTALDPGTKWYEAHSPLRWTPAISLYLRGQPSAAADLLPGDDPEMMAARAMLQWEAGDVDAARETWTALIEKHPGNWYAELGRNALETGNY